MILVFTPYGIEEATAAALALADSLIAQGRTVKVVAIGRDARPYGREVHARWDSQVISGKNTPLLSLVAKATKCIWFYMDLPIATAVYGAEGIVTNKHIVVVDWVSLRFSLLLEMSLMRYSVVVGSGYAAESMIGKLIPHNTAAAIKPVTWASGLKSVSKSNRSKYTTTHVMIVCDRHTIEGNPALILAVANEMLQDNPTMIVHLLATKSWNAFARKRLKRHQQTHGVDRLVFHDRTPINRWNAIIAQMDWCIIPTSVPTVPYIASVALSCGVPVVTTGVPPYDELVKKDVHGLHVETEYGIRNGVMFFGFLSSERLMDTLHCTAITHDVANSLRRKSWGLKRRNKEFKDFWNNLLDSPTIKEDSGDGSSPENGGSADSD